MRSPQTRLALRIARQAVFAAAFATACVSLSSLGAAARSPLIVTVSASREMQEVADARIVVGITNRSNATMWVGRPAICEMTSLIVTDASGSRKQPDPDRNSNSYTCPEITTISIVVFEQILPGHTYYGCCADPSGSRLTDWGYHLKPGKYTVQAVLENFTTTRTNPGHVDWPAGATAPTPPRRDVHPTVKSNIVTLVLD